MSNVLQFPSLKKAVAEEPPANMTIRDFVWHLVSAQISPVVINLVHHKRISIALEQIQVAYDRISALKISHWYVLPDIDGQTFESIWKILKMRGEEKKRKELIIVVQEILNHVSNGIRTRNMPSLMHETAVVLGAALYWVQDIFPDIIQFLQQDNNSENWEPLNLYKPENLQFLIIWIHDFLSKKIASEESEYAA